MRLLLFLLFPLSLSAFVVDPWFSNIGEFQLRSTYSYRYYPQMSQSQTSYHSNDHLIDLNLGLTFLPSWEAQLESDFSDIQKLSWGAERLGAQIRYLMLNDVAGDPVSLTIGGQLFYVPSRNLRDVSCPYHAEGNLELGVGMGKELGGVYHWLYRLHGFFGIGTGNRGSPWLHPSLSVEMKYGRPHKFQLTADGSFGLGKQSLVFVDRFHGYAKIKHRSVDLSLGYSYHFKIWGSLEMQCVYRLYAYACPERVGMFTMSYHFPFSIF